MPPVILRRLLARAPDSDKTEAGVKALVSVFFHILSPLPAFVGGTLAPEPFLPRCTIASDCPCFPAWRRAYRLHPPSTSRVRVQDFALVDGGAPAARYSGSAAGAGGQRDWGAGCGMSMFDRRARFARGYLSATQLLGNCAGRPAQIQNFSFASSRRSQRTAKEDMATRQLLYQVVEQLPCNNI